MNIEQILALARPFRFHSLPADAPAPPTPAPVRTPTRRPKKPSSVWFRVSHAILRRTPYGRGALIGIFTSYPEAAAHASRFHNYQTSTRIHRPLLSSTVWTDDEHISYIIFPYMEPYHPTLINPVFDKTRPNRGLFHVKNATSDGKPTVKVRFDTYGHAHQYLMNTIPLPDRPTFTTDEGRHHEWIRADGSRFVIHHARSTIVGRWKNHIKSPPRLSRKAVARKAIEL